MSISASLIYGCITDSPETGLSRILLFGQGLLLSSFSRLVVSSSLRPHGLQHTGFLSFTISWSLLKLMSIESAVPSTLLVFCRPFSCLQSFPASGSFLLSHIRWPKYWSFEFSISPSNEYSGLISFSSAGLSRGGFSLLCVVLTQECIHLGA